MYKNLLNFAARFLKQRTITHKDNENRFSIFNHFTGGIHPTRMDLHKNTAGSCSSSSFNSTLPMGRLKSSQWHCSCLYHLHDDCNSPMVNVYGSTVCFRGNSADVENKTHACNNQTATNESTAQKPVFLLEAIPVYNESEGIDTACEAETAEEISETEVIEEAYMAETGELAKDNHISVTYQQGIDDFYQSQAESQKKKLDTIHEYLLYIMSPFVYEEDMDEFCTDLLRFAMDHNYRPEVEWKRYKTKLSSFDVRHMVWSIATRLGLGKGKVYSNDDCACYIERRFASLCVTASGEPLSHNTLRNLTVTSNSDQIHCDYPGKDGLLFHIPLQLGGEKG